MPARNQAMIRRQINRLNETVERLAETQPALAAIKPVVAAAADQVNDAWQVYQATALSGDKERDERDQAVAGLLSWHQQWRPVVLVLVPGAKDSLRVLPATGATPDDVIRVCDDLVRLINDDPATASFREAALSQLGEGIEQARQEAAEATATLPAEAAARQAYSDACEEANTVLVRGSEVIRAIFGRTSPEYKQFVSRASAQEEDEIEAESQTGEGGGGATSPA